MCLKRKGKWIIDFKMYVYYCMCSIEAKNIVIKQVEISNFTLSYHHLSWTWHCIHTRSYWPVYFRSKDHAIALLLSYFHYPPRPRSVICVRFMYKYFFPFFNPTPFVLFKDISWFNMLRLLFADRIWIA